MRTKRKRRNLALLVILIVLAITIFFLGLIAGFYIKKEEETKIIIENKTTIVDIEKIEELSKEGLVPVSIEIEPGTIYLASECLQLSIITTMEQTTSIEQAIENKTIVRPIAHDLLNYIIENFDIEFLFVKIHSMREGTYYAKIFLQQDNKILILDSRPSDAIALALRARSEIYVKKELLERYGKNIC